MDTSMKKLKSAGKPVQRLMMAGAFIMIAGCVSPVMETSAVDVHATATSIGTGWVYRAKQGSTERIQTGTQQEVGISQMRSDSQQFQRFFEKDTAEISIKEDGAGPYLLISLNDNATKRMHIYQGGPYSWDMKHLASSVERLIDNISTDNPRYSIHLIATRDEGRLGLTPDTVAQMRLRRFADLWLQRAVDPRQITGQIIPPTYDVQWKLGIALRPYQYGNEHVSAQLIAPWTLK